MALTYSKVDQFPKLCDILGQRLESSEDINVAVNACLCYICAGNVHKLVACWSRLVQDGNEAPLALQDLVEKAMVLKQAMENNGHRIDVGTGQLGTKLSQYASLLAMQGCFQAAMTYLGDSKEAGLAILRDRLYYSLPADAAAAPAKPFQEVKLGAGVTPARTAQASKQQANVQQPTQVASPRGSYPTSSSTPHQPNYQASYNPAASQQPMGYQGSQQPYPGPTMYNPNTLKPQSEANAPRGTLLEAVYQVNSLINLYQTTVHSTSQATLDNSHHNIVLTTQPLA
jgi:protein transport protein SEC31